MEKVYPVLRFEVSRFVALAKMLRDRGRWLRHLPVTLRDQVRSTYGDPRAIPAGEWGRYFTLADCADMPREQIINLADRACEHRFDLLGSGWVRVAYGMTARGVEGFQYVGRGSDQTAINRANHAESGRIRALIDPAYSPIDWQIDFKSGWRWSERTPFTAIRFGAVPGADVKVPWELARMQHLPMLAQATTLIHDPRYAREFRNQVLDFMAANPPRFGVNWASPMDVAIRVAGWLVAYDLFREGGTTFDADFERELRRSVYLHGAHLRANLERQRGWRGNHYLSDLAGLLFVAAYLSNTTETEAWYSFARAELLSEAALQFNPDGSSREGSTAYHRLAAEIVFYATLLMIRRGDRAIPAEHYERLQGMAAFSEAITQPDGHFPQIGDNDNGRFLKLHATFRLGEDGDWREDHLDQRYLVGLIRGVTSPPSPLSVKEPHPPTPSPQTAKGSKTGAPPPNREGKSNTIHIIADAQNADLRDRLQRFDFPDFGLYIFRSPHVYLAIRCGAIGQNGRGGHAHNDQLSFTLWLDGHGLPTDPGTYLYTPLPALRDRYRSARVHNGPRPALPDREPGRLDLGMFRLGDNAHAECLTLTPNLFCGRHFGYGFAVYRTVTIGEYAVWIEDSADVDGIAWLPPQRVPIASGYGIVSEGN